MLDILAQSLQAKSEGRLQRWVPGQQQVSRLAAALFGFSRVQGKDRRDAEVKASDHTRIISALRRNPTVWVLVPVVLLLVIALSALHAWHLPLEDQADVPVSQMEAISILETPPETPPPHVETPGEAPQQDVGYLSRLELDEAEAQEELMPDTFRARLASGGPFTDQELRLVDGIEEMRRRQEAYEARVRAESLEETIHHLLYDPDILDFPALSSNASFVGSPARAIREAFSQGRVAKILEAARHGTPEERKALGESIVHALHEYMATTPLAYDPDNAQQRNISAMMGAHYLALALPLVDSGTEYFNTVTYLHALHQEGMHATPGRDTGDYTFSEAGLFLGYVQNEYLRRIAADPAATMPGMSPAQQEVIQEYLELGSYHMTEALLTDVHGQAPIFDLSTRFWEDESQ